MASPAAPAPTHSALPQTETLNIAMPSLSTPVTADDEATCPSDCPVTPRGPEARAAASPPRVRALPQSPGPSGSRVVKKRPSLPRLGEGLGRLLPAFDLSAIRASIPASDNNSTEPTIIAHVDACYASRPSRQPALSPRHKTFHDGFLVHESGHSTTQDDGRHSLSSTLKLQGEIRGCDTTIISEKLASVVFDGTSYADHLDDASTSQPSDDEGLHTARSTTASLDSTRRSSPETSPPSSVATYRTSVVGHRGEIAKSITPINEALQSGQSPERRPRPHLAANFETLWARKVTSGESAITPGDFSIDSQPATVHVHTPPVSTAPVKQAAEPCTTYEDLLRLEHSLGSKAPAKRFAFAYSALESTTETLETRVKAQQQDKRASSLQSKLHHELKIDQGLRKSTGASAYAHVFVDMSNIFIGFINTYKLSRGIPQHQQIKVPPFDFDSLSYILERGRKVNKRVLAGSVARSAARRSTWPQYLQCAEKLDYTMKIFDRVSIEVPSRRPMLTTPYGKSLCRTSSEESSDDGDIVYTSKMGEQGVDENLHLEILDSIVDCDDASGPGTMVLATGDANTAQFSKGFLHYIEKAIRHRWNVEVICWKRTVGQAWKELAATHGAQFRLIYLDSYLDELNKDAT